jgi:hypothetical protein
MKRKHFLGLILVALVTMFVIGFSSCEKPKPACEVNHTGDVKIINQFPGVITVDIWDGYGYLGEQVLGIGQSVTYRSVNAGAIEIWEEDAYSDWGYWDQYLTQCETLNFTIYQGKSVSFEAGGDISQKVIVKKNK